MHTWRILSGAWTAVVITYCVLGIVAEARLRGEAKRRSRLVFLGFAALYLVREVVRRLLGGLVFQLLVTVVGVAAGIAALVVAKMLISQPPSVEGRMLGSKDHIQPLKLR